MRLPPNRRVFLCSIGLLLCAAAPKPPAPAKAERAPAVSAKRQSFLIELRRRGIIAADADAWTPEQYTLLLRVREAEALGAFDLLRAKLGGLVGAAVEHKGESDYKELWLTQAGYRKFIFILSQDARAYFESKGAEAKWVFSLRSLAGRRLFDSKGILTQEGIDVYNRVRRDLEVFWKHGDGSVNGTVRPSPEVIARARASSARGPAAKPLPPAPGGERPRPEPAGELDESAAMKKVEALVKSGYVEISPSEFAFLLQTTKLDESRLRTESSLQIIATRDRTHHLISPSDPLMALVARYRASGGELE